MKSLYEKPYESQKLPPQVTQAISPSVLEPAAGTAPVATPIVIAPAATPTPPKGIVSSAPPAPATPAAPITPSVPVLPSVPMTPPPAAKKPEVKPFLAKPAPAPTVTRTPAPAPAPAAIAVPVPAPAPIPAADSTLGSQRVLLVGRIVAIVITVAMLGLIGRVAQLQVSPPPELDPLIGSQYSTTPLMGRRGSITDREGRILATTGLAHRLYVDPKRVADPGTFPEFLGFALGYDPAKIGKRLHDLADKRYVVIDQKLDDAQLLKLESIRAKADRARAAATTNTATVDDVQWKRLTGLYTDLWLERQYPQGAVGGAIIGFVGQEGHGFEGAERIFNTQLTGKPGTLGYLRDAGHRPMDVNLAEYVQPVDGKPVRLSIDITIQAIAESELAKACQQFGAKTGEMVIMDPHTGEIIAMANYPSFDPNEVRTTHPDIRRNRCVTDPFEPGSTFKPFIWAAAVEQGFARPETMVNTDQSVGRPLRDTHDHGTISWGQVLIKSSNRGMAIIGQKMGNTKLFNAVKSFGFGEPTRSGFSGESRGIVNPLNKWNARFSPTSVPMGQEISVTPLQLARAFCVFANGGFLVSPTIIAKDENDPHAVTVVQRVLSPRTTQIAKDTLRLVMTEGTGRMANSKQYAMFGKTGTAQVAKKNGGGYEPGAYNGVFVAGAPLDNPRLVVACVVHKPDARKGYYGGIVAAPAVMKTIDRTLNYMGVTPMPSPLVEEHRGPRLARD